MFSAMMEKIGNEIIALAFFAGGALLGVLLVFLALFFLSKAKIKEKPRKEKADLSSLKEEIKSEFKGAKTGFDFKSKAALFSDVAIKSAEKICAVYGGEEAEYFDLFGKISLSLNFTVYEFIDFLSEFTEYLRRDVEDVFSSAKFRVMFFAYKIIDGKIDKDPTEVKLAYVFSVLTEEKEEKKGFFSKVIGGIAAPIKSLAVKAVKPSVAGLIDDFFVSALYSFSDCASDLYSRKFSGNGEENEPSDIPEEERGEAV